MNIIKKVISELSSVGKKLAGHNERRRKKATKKKKAKSKHPFKYYETHGRGKDNGEHF